MNALSLSSPAVVERIVLRSRKPAAPGASNDFDMAYRSPEGRRFEVREFEDGTYFLSEMRPNGRIHREVDGHSVYTDEPRLRRVLDDPKACMERARRLGVEDTMIMGGQGLGVATIYHRSLGEVAAAICSAVASNRWYDSVDHAKLADSRFQAHLERAEVAAREEHRQGALAMHERAVAEENGIFKGLHSMMGPLSDDRKKAIL